MIYNDSNEAVHSALASRGVATKSTGAFDPANTNVESKAGWESYQFSVSVKALEAKFPPKDTGLYLLNGN